MSTLKKFGFIVDRFALGTPDQQLLDRFLIGFSRSGEFIPTPAGKVCLWAGQDSDKAALAKRASDFGLELVDSPSAATRDVDGAIVVQRDGRLPSAVCDLLSLVSAIAPGKPVFNLGLPSASAKGSEAVFKLAQDRGVPLLSGTEMATTWRLPELKISSSAKAREAVVVVQGSDASAEISALDGLLPVVENCRGVGGKLRRVRFFEGDALWKAGESGEWSWSLLSAALSRSDSPQGHPVLDGRTEDLAGLGLVPGLAKNPRGWILEHEGGLRTTVLVLDGVVADYLMAVKTGGVFSAGEIFSTQLFRGPLPQSEQFSRLAGVVFDFLTTGKEPWSRRRTLLQTAFFEHANRPHAKSGNWEMVSS